MFGSCHLDRMLNVEIGVECQIFVIVIFFNCGRVLQFRSHSRYFKGASTQKRSFLVICTSSFIEIVPRGGPPLKKGGPPLEFINTQPLKRGSASKILQDTAPQKGVPL